MSAPVKRLSRVEQQERTRAALLDAAVALFIERGIEATTIEEVTARAGFSRGAFYSNFESKDDLFLAATAHFFEQLFAADQGLADDDPESAGRHRFDALRGVADNAASIYIAEACLYAYRHNDVAEGLAELHREQLAGTMAFVEAALAQFGIENPPASIATLANITQAATFGLHLKELVDPSVHAADAAGVLLSLALKGMSGDSQPKRAKRSRPRPTA